MANGESGTAPKGAEPSTQLAPVQPAVVIKSGESSRAWQLISLLAPAILAAYLTFLSGRSENRIKQGIESQGAVLSAQLRLNEELYRRRIDTYEKLYVQLKSLEMKVQDRATTNSTGDLANANREIADLLKELSQARGMSELHMSDDVSRLMGDAWREGVRGTPESFAAKISVVEKQMKSELESKMQEPAKVGGT